MKSPTLPRRLLVVAVVLLVTACGGDDSSSTDQAAASESAVVDDSDSVRAELEAGLRFQLAEGLVATEGEADCVTDWVMSDWERIEAMLDQPGALADEILDRVDAAEEACFTTERRAAIQGEGSAGEVDTAELDATEEAFLSAASTIDGVTGAPGPVLEAGRATCTVVAALGSLTPFVATLAADAGAAETLGAQLARSLGSELDADGLNAFSIAAVVSFCPELNDL